MGNVARVAVEVANAGSEAELTTHTRQMMNEHQVTLTAWAELAPLLAPLRAAVAAVADGGDVTAVNQLLTRFPPRLHLSAHDGPGTAHLHYAPDGEPPARWLGRTCAAALAHVASGAPEVTVGRCRATGCARFFVDQSRNRSRRFCSNTCASRTTVAAHRARNRTE
ncbi:CGNR zinc finger domain-containing protein [Streptomyces sp. NPDC050738]|uniref:CGNR zinc finger domain-containing protein n=1 Tax=Streptomyces sp. NPDC050738 TaxID=3154744 RepID=UPI00341E35D6